MKLAFVGNCQAQRLSEIVGRGFEVEASSYVLPKTFSTEPDAASRIVGDADIVFLQTILPQKLSGLATGLAKPGARVLGVPSIYYDAFHPDYGYAPGLISIFGAPVSKILSFGFLSGLDPARTRMLFDWSTYEALGYLDCADAARSHLLADGDACGIDLREALERWRASGVFVYVPNHPAIAVLADIGRLVGEAHGLAPRIGAIEPTPDGFEHLLRWPVYPEIAERFGQPGDMIFRKRPLMAQPRMAIDAFDLRQFVDAFYELNKDVDKQAILARSPDVFEPFKAVRIPLPRRPRPARPANPYAALPDERYWRRAVAGVAPAELDPVVDVKFQITRATKIATAGSCFAQHVARRLKRSGFNHFVPEDGARLPAAEREERQFGVYSARFGNLYTARQLAQLIERSEGAFTPVDDVWRRDGRFFDPFRPEVEPDGFESAEAVREDRARHLAHVRELWRELDVFVFTLGLTESWRSTVDGAVFPVAPGIVGDDLKTSDYAFHNFSAAEIERDMLAFVDRLAEINPRAKVLLTVSPVPLVATFEKRHVLVSTTYSKSALRVAVEEVVRRRENVEYFPSYEIITGPHARGAYFEDDLRSVAPQGVDHVMRIFMRHLGGAAAPAELSDHRMKAIEHARAVICEEELNDIETLTFDKAGASRRAEAKQPADEAAASA